MRETGAGGLPHRLWKSVILSSRTLIRACYGGWWREVTTGRENEKRFVRGKREKKNKKPPFSLHWGREFCLTRRRSLSLISMLTVVGKKCLLAAERTFARCNDTDRTTVTAAAAISRYAFSAGTRLARFSPRGVPPPKTQTVFSC